MTTTTFTDLITDESQLPSFAAILRDHAALGECDLDELQRALDHRAQSMLH